MDTAGDETTVQKNISPETQGRSLDNNALLPRYENHIRDIEKVDRRETMTSNQQDHGMPPISHLLFFWGGSLH